MTASGWLWRLGLLAAVAWGSAGCSGARPSGRGEPAAPPAEPSGPRSAVAPAGAGASSAPPSVEPSPALAPEPKQGGSALERTYTGQAQPSVVVDNGYPQTQHVFVDGAWLGSVEPGASGAFDVAVGAHTFTSADSRDPNDNPSSITELFESGYRYSYRIRPR